MCGPEFSDLEATVRQRYSEDDVLVLGLNSGQDSTSDLNAFIRAFQVSFPMLRFANTPYWQYRQSGALSPYPLDYVIDQEGNVAYFGTEYEPEDITLVINNLLGLTSGTPDIPPAKKLDLMASPNPFNPQTNIVFTLKHSQPVSLDILDARGHLVRTLLSSEVRPGGLNKLSWNGQDDQGQSLSSGLYLAQIKTLHETAITKLTLVR